VDDNKRMEAEFQVEHSPSGDTVMVRNRKAVTILLRGQVMERLERMAEKRGVPPSSMLEAIIEECVGSEPKRPDRSIASPQP